MRLDIQPDAFPLLQKNKTFPFVELCTFFLFLPLHVEITNSGPNFFLESLKAYNLGKTNFMPKVECKKLNKKNVKNLKKAKVCD